MKTSKLLITSLLAAAAMSVPAWAEDVSGSYTWTSNGADILTGDNSVAAGTTLTITKGSMSTTGKSTVKLGDSLTIAGTLVLPAAPSAGESRNAGTEIKADIATNIILMDGGKMSTDDGAMYFSKGVQVGDGTSTASSVTFEIGNWAKGNVISALTGAGTFNFTRNGSSEIGLLALSADWSSAGKTEADAFAGTIRVSGTNRLALMADSAAKNAVIDLASSSSLHIGYATSGDANSNTVSTRTTSLNTIVAGLSGSGSVVSNIADSATARDTLTLNVAGGTSYTSSAVIGTSAKTISIVKSGDGGQTLSGTKYINNLDVSNGELVLSGTTNIAGTMTVGVNGELVLSGGTITLANAIQNSGTVTVSGMTVFNLTQEGETILISGGRINGWDLIRNSNFTYYGVGVDTMRSSVNFSTEGVVTLSYSVADLTWAGTSESSTWNTTTTNTNWTNESSADSFYNYDNVTFGANAAEKTVTLENGANLTVGTMTVEGSSPYKFSLASGTATISGATLTVASGATLQIGASDLRTVSLDFENISLSGKIIYQNGVSTWKKLTFASADAEMNIEDLTGGTGLTISTMQMDAAGSLTANWGGRVAISALTGSGNLTICKPQTEAITYAIESLANYTGTLSMEGSGRELTVLLTGNNTGFTGNVKVSTGILGVNNSNALGSGTLTLNGGTLRADANNLSFANAVNVAAASIIKTQTNTLTLSGAVSGTGTLTKQGTGTLVLTNAGTTTNVAFAEGNLKIAQATVNVVSTTSAGNIEFTGTGGTVVFKGTSEPAGTSYTVGTISTNTTSNNYTRNVTIESGATVTATSFTNSWGMGALRVDGELNVTGALSFATGDNNNQTSNIISGDGTVKVGSLNIGNIGTYTISVNRLEIGSGGITTGTNRTTGKTTYLGNTTIVVSESWTGAVSSSQKFMLNSSEGTTFELQKADGTATNAEFASIFGGTGKLIKTGAGMLTLSGANTFTGGVEIAKGVVKAMNEAALGAAANVVRIAGGQLEVGSGVTLAQTNISVVLNDGAYLAGAAIFGGADKATSILATGTTISVSGDVEALKVVCTSATGRYDFTLYDNNTLTTTGVPDVTVVGDFATALAGAGWTYSLSEDKSILTISVPEPSVFGLLAGLGALALAGTRRRRRKA